MTYSMTCARVHTMQRSQSRCSGDSSLCTYRAWNVRVARRVHRICMTPARAGRGGASLTRPGQSATVNAVPTLEQVGRCQSDLTGDAFACNFSPHQKKSSHICMQMGIRARSTRLSYLHANGSSHKTPRFRSRVGLRTKHPLYSLQWGHTALIFACKRVFAQNTQTSKSSGVEWGGVRVT